MPASARIEVVAGNAAGTSLDLTDELLIGRHADGAGRLGDDEEISRYHARISLDAGGRCTVEDLGSTNGTFVNGSRISVPQTLKQGDTINLGASTLIVRELPAPAAADPPSDSPAEAARYAEPPAPVAAAPEPTPAAAAPEPPAPVAAGPEPSAPAAEPPAPVAAAPEPTPVTRAPDPVPEPTPDPVPAPPAPIPQLSLRLEVDFANSEALISLGDGAEPLRIVLESGVWRIA